MFYAVMDPNVDLCYLSAGCNCSPHTVDWSSNLICYASSYSIVVNSCKDLHNEQSTFTTLNGHSGRVNSVRWIKKHTDNGENELISTSADRTSRVWKIDNETKTVCSYILKGHKDTVTTADGHYVPTENGETLLIVTASADSTIRIWERNDEKSAEFVCHQIEDLRNGFALDLKIALLPIILVPIFAAATDDANIVLFAQQQNSFVRLHTLTGHEDWVRCLDFTCTASEDLLLASGGQDCSIRLWKIHQWNPDAQYLNCPIAELPNDREITLNENIFKITDKDVDHHFAVVLDAVMIGHENWIYGVHWKPNHDENEPLCLLSSSMDKTIILWTPTPPSGVWLEKVRLGEVSVNTAGFYGSKFNSSGNSIITHGYQGSFHLWNYNKESDMWIPQSTFGGHFGEVNDIDWECTGKYLLSVSLDQTTRLHAPWIKEDSKITWHEFARPQIHGYDMTCVASISHHKFISGADEKILRVFEAPRAFLKNFSLLCKIDPNEELQKLEGIILPEGATVPALSLSNKAVFELNEEERNDDKNSNSVFLPLELKEPPTEEDLVRSTLWPETKKLYGHGYEIFCVACNHKATIVASTCKASKPEHASILLWDVETWKIIGELLSHTLTVTQLEFSPNDQYLLSISRDRTWTLFKECNSNDSKLFQRIAYTDKSTSIHSRIIWSCSWTHDSKYFATGSRDKKVIIWGNSGVRNESGNCSINFGALSSPLILKNAVTALNFSHTSFLTDQYLLAIGLESGEIHLYFWKSDTIIWNHCHQFEEHLCHHLSVQRLRFQPLSVTFDNSDKFSRKEFQLASCGKDHAVRIFNISFKENVS